jgi:two-component system, NtrC family, nitrogen regulation response regulator NtrX
MRGAHILIADDEAGIRTQLAAILKDEGYTVTAVASGEEVLGTVARDLVDLVLLDVWLPGIDGIETLRQLRGSGQRLPVVVISGHASAEVAVRAVREGAFDFLEKPLGLDRVLVTVRNALEQARLQRHLAREEPETLPVLTGVSPAVMELRRQILLAAPTDSRVLITGPNGAGKEVVARLLHHHSQRSAEPWIVVNCAAIPAELIESELFGHVKGAYTGAVDSRRGCFELADGGTLFLDEIGDMGLGAQARVLRVLQESRFTRLGGSHEVAVDVRVLAATNKDLEQEIEAGAFRRDLFFRLNVIPIRVPGLAERREDIPLLVEQLVGRLAGTLGRPPKVVSREALELLQAHHWPGNVRELKNLVERWMIMVEGDVIGPGQVGLAAQAPTAAGQALTAAGQAPIPAGQTPAASRDALMPLREARQRFEREYMEQVVAACGGNMTRAARLLGLERSHLYRKLRGLRGGSVPRGRRVGPSSPRRGNNKG